MLTSEKHASSLACEKIKANPKDPSKESTYLHNLLLEFLNVFVSCVIVAPCVIAYWRGTWELLDLLIFPHNASLSALTSFVIGSLGHFVFTFAQTYFKSHIHPDKRRLTFYVFSRCYTAIFGIVCVNMWRGSWILCEKLTSVDSLNIVSLVTLVALLFLISTRTLRNLGAAPYLVIVDQKSNYFEVVTLFKVPGFQQPGLYFLDTFLSIFFVGILVIISWRGLWGIMDLTLYKNSLVSSAWASLIVGYITVSASFLIQPIMRFICNKTEGLYKIFTCDIFFLLCFFGTVNIWRGIWILMDIYIYPDNPILSYGLTHIIPFLILVALKCSNSLLVRGVYIDAEETGGKCVDMPVNCVKLHFQRERSKKHSRMHFEQQHSNKIDKNNDKMPQGNSLDKPMKTDSNIRGDKNSTQVF